MTEVEASVAETALLAAPDAVNAAAVGCGLTVVDVGVVDASRASPDDTAVDVAAAAAAAAPDAGGNDASSNPDTAGSMDAPSKLPALGSEAAGDVPYPPPRVLRGVATACVSNDRMEDLPCTDAVEKEPNRDAVDMFVVLPAAGVRPAPTAPPPPAEEESAWCVWGPANGSTTELAVDMGVATAVAPKLLPPLCRASDKRDLGNISSALNRWSPVVVAVLEPRRGADVVTVSAANDGARPLEAVGNDVSLSLEAGEPSGRGWRACCCCCCCCWRWWRCW